MNGLEFLREGNSITEGGFIGIDQYTIGREELKKCHPLELPGIDVVKYFDAGEVELRLIAKHSGFTFIYTILEDEVKWRRYEANNSNKGYSRKW